ncbi:AMP-dependent synthetase [Enemella evansiae]|uniref:AMP-binding protein n=1 Tax=Enemella evansiae TaxID=2016499 RepID=UPI000B96940E|nr:AMP-binding protein [Enemella evansiae]OYO09857.1 AMP-dependent synthetase [Enemella evansiae]
MLLRPLPAADPALVAALRQALDGGPALAPLPADPQAAEAALAMLRPDQPLEHTDTALIVATSGSTGTPKGVLLSADAIRAGVIATHQALGGPGDWVLALPAHYVAGIMVIARTLVAGTELAYADPRLGDLPTPTRPTYLSLVPTQLHRALDSAELTETLRAYAAILLGGAAAPQPLLDRAAAAGVRVVTSYGMSETCGGCVYDGVPLPGLRVDLLGERQRIALSGPMLFSGYRLRPELTAETLQDGRLLTNDRGEWVPRRPSEGGNSSRHARCASHSMSVGESKPLLRVLGRLDDVVISGGVNVDLAAVERELHRHWPQAAAIGVPDETWGQLVVAAGTDLPDLATLRETLDTLAPEARPRGLLRLDVLPTTSSGKVDRQRLIARWPDHHDKELL